RLEALDRRPRSPRYDVAGRSQQVFLRGTGQETDMPSIMEAANLPIPLISICVCTYRRPAQLEQLLKMLDQQATWGLFRFSVVVVDNDARQSARGTVESAAQR